MASSPSRGTLWVPEGSYLRPIKVQVGISDESGTEVAGSDLAEGMNVVIGEQMPQISRAGGGNAPGTSPFTPQLGRARSAAQTGGAGGPGSGGPGGGGRGGNP